MMGRHVQAVVTWIEGYAYERIPPHSFVMLGAKKEVFHNDSEGTMTASQRSGRYLLRAFVPHPLPPDPPLRLDTVLPRPPRTGKQQIASLAILGDDRPNWRPSTFGYTLWGCVLRLDFPTVKLLDYDPAILATHTNPCATVVLAHHCRNY